MKLKLGHLRQIALPSSNLLRSIQFYRDILGIEFIAKYDSLDLLFFRLGETRLLLEHSPGTTRGTVLYFDVPDIDQAYSTLRGRGVHFDSAPHLIHRDKSGTFGPVGSEEWKAFFKDPDGNVPGIGIGKAAEGRLTGNWSRCIPRPLRSCRRGAQLTCDVCRQELR